VGGAAVVGGAGLAADRGGWRAGLKGLLGPGSEWSSEVGRIQKPVSISHIALSHTRYQIADSRLAASR
jgi:hypothetical protein